MKHPCVSVGAFLERTDMGERDDGEWTSSSTWAVPFPPRVARVQKKSSERAEHVCDTLCPFFGSQWVFGCCCSPP